MPAPFNPLAPRTQIPGFPGGLPGTMPGGLPGGTAPRQPGQMIPSAPVNVPSPTGGVLRVPGLPTAPLPPGAPLPGQQERQNVETIRNQERGRADAAAAQERADQYMRDQALLALEQQRLDNEGGGMGGGTGVRTPSGGGGGTAGAGGRSIEDEIRLARELSAIEQANQLAMLREQAGLQSAAETRRGSEAAGRLPGIMGTLDSSESVAAPDPRIGEEASRAAYTQARESAGLNTQAALKSLQNLFQGRGISGSGLEAASFGEPIAEGARDITDVTTRQAIDALDRSRDLEDRNYAGALTRRGQNAGLIPSILSQFQNTGRAF